MPDRATGTSDIGSRIALDVDGTAVVAYVARTAVPTEPPRTPSLSLTLLT